MPLPFQRRGGAQLRPTFSRDFAGLKTLDHGVGPAITFTRASNATFFDANGVLQTASNDQPRFDHDPASGNASRGLLIEEARTNLLVRSAELDHAAWAKVSTTVTANSIAAPDGTTSAETIQDTNAAGDAYIRQIISSPANATTYTASVFLKQGTTATSRVSLDFTGATSINRDATITWSNNTTNYGTLQSVGNGWYRLAFSETNNSSGNTSFLFTIRASGDPTGAETGTVYAWGAQLEAGAFPTSYIPTTTADATRSADSAVVTPIASFYNQSEGTLFAECASTAVPSSGEAGIFRLSATSGATNEVRIRFVNSFIAGQVHSTEGETASFVTAAASGITYRACLAYANNDAAFSVSGASASSDTSVVLPTSVARAVIGAGALAAGGFLNGHIRKIAYYPRRLSNTLLQQLTT